MQPLEVFFFFFFCLLIFLLLPRETSVQDQGPLQRADPLPGAARGVGCWVLGVRCWVLVEPSFLTARARKFPHNVYLFNCSPLSDHGPLLSCPPCPKTAIQKRDHGDSCPPCPRAAIHERDHGDEEGRHLPVKASLPTDRVQCQHCTYLLTYSL